MINNLLQRLINYFIPESHKTEVQLFKKAENIVSTTLTGIGFLFIILPFNIYLNIPYTLLVNSLAIVALILNLYGFKKELSRRIYSNILTLVSFTTVFVSAIETGGIFSPVVPYFVVVGIIVFLYANNLVATLWIAVISFSTIFLAIIQILFPLYSKIKSKDQILFYTTTNLSLVIFSTYLIRFYINILKNISKRNFLKTEKMEKYNQMLAEQQEIIKKKNEELLQLYQEYNKQNKDLLLQKELLEIQNQELNRAYAELIDSVYYTKRIQEALLPSMQAIKPYFSDLMILYKPKEILSGDFYWFAEVNEYLFLALADCTGHGIPGAFMTVIGNDLLNRIIKEDYTFHPNEILKKLDKELLKTLQKDRPSLKLEIINDGMDIALCRIDKESNEICFAGAKRPLFIVNEQGVQEIKGSRFGIGGYLGTEKFFEEHRFIFSEKDVFYMTSDGFTDQFGGDNNTKFLVARFKEVLKEIYQKPMEVQKQKLNDIHENWRGYINEQTDDILVIGFRI